MRRGGRRRRQWWRIRIDACYINCDNNCDVSDRRTNHVVVSYGELGFPDLVKRAWETRPDLRQARLQVTNGERQVAGAANAAKPEVDVYGTYESRGVVSRD